jgi:uracil phosphoribosyltransferase
MERGVVKEIHIAVIAAPEGIAHLKNILPDTCHLAASLMTN